MGEIKAGEEYNKKIKLQLEKERLGLEDKRQTLKRTADEIE